MAAVTGAWITLLETGPSARVRLFCIPYAGGAAAAFRTWPAGLPELVQVHPMQLPGRGSRLRERPLDRIEPLAEGIADAIFPLTDRPVAIFGHSMGALIAFEVARRLRRKYATHIAHLFVAGRCAPQDRERGKPTSHLPDREFLGELRRLNGTPRAVLENSELMELLLPAIRADFAVSEQYRYVPEAPFPCPISVFGGREDHLASREELEGWRAQTSGPFNLRMLEGDHWFPHTAQGDLLAMMAGDLLGIARAG